MIERLSCDSKIRKDVHCMDKYYNSAYKMGMKEYRNAISRGAYPYLSVLDEMIPNKKNLPGTDMGIIQIPIELIVGTKTVGRTTTFAGNFMPIADESSEFADKWKSLCRHHLEEGIRDPVVVYEYMNRYYALEGNKRISVLKYFGAVTIAARVYRIMPDRSDDPNVILYYEHYDFYKETKINFIEFSNQGCYAEFLSILKAAGFGKWNDEELKRIRTDYYYFEQAYQKCGGAQVKITTADALLAYLRVYGYEKLHNLSNNELKNTLTRMWQEIMIQQEESPVEIQLHPETKKTNLMTNLFGAKKTHVAFLYYDSPERSSWVFGHENGRQYVQKKYPDRLITDTYVVSEDHPVSEQIKNAAFDGAEIIFATSPEMLSECVRMAVEYPNLTILNCTLNKPQKSVCMYYPRMYESKFITGAVAAALSEDDRIGYICKYPIFSSIAEINAFARGVRMINPQGEVYLEWSDNCTTQEAAEKLNALGINLISVRDRLKESLHDRVMFGLEWVENGEFTPLVLPMWNWGIYYDKIMQSIWNGSLRSKKEATSKSLNYYWGMSEEVVEMVYSDSLPEGVLYLANVLEKAICAGICQPFYNPDDNVRVTEEDLEKGIPVEQLMAMTKLEVNVVGEIPDYSDMREDVKTVVEAIGLPAAKGKTLK